MLRYTRVSQKSYNIEVLARLEWCVYYVTDAVQAVVGTHCG